jgi:hypothetical protein
MIKYVVIVIIVNLLVIGAFYEGYIRGKCVIGEGSKDRERIDLQVEVGRLRWYISENCNGGLWCDTMTKEITVDSEGVY